MNDFIVLCFFQFFLLIVSLRPKLMMSAFIRVWLTIWKALPIVLIMYQSKKFCQHLLIEPIIRVINISFRFGIFSGVLKQLGITVIFKSWEHNLVRNYSPISAQIIYWEKYLKNAWPTGSRIKLQNLCHNPETIWI